MNAEIKAKWLAALRSGFYRQGTGELRSKDNKFCCLGVLTDIVAGRPAWRESKITGGYSIDDSGALCPRSVKDAAAIDDGACRFLAIQMNDAGKSFAEIADYIEKNL